MSRDRQLLLIVCYYKIRDNCTVFQTDIFALLLASYSKSRYASWIEDKYKISRNFWIQREQTCCWEQKRFKGPSNSLFEEGEIYQLPVKKSGFTRWYDYDTNEGMGVIEVKRSPLNKSHFFKRSSLKGRPRELPNNQKHINCI